MPAPPFLARRGAYAAARQQVTKKNVSHTLTTTKPAGMLETASRASLLPLQISGGRLLESNPGGASWAPHHWYGGCPVGDKMNTLIYRATMTVSNSSAGTDRGALVFVGAHNGSGGDGLRNLVWFRIRGSGGLKAVIGTKMGDPDTAMHTDRLVSTSNYLVSANDTIGLEISVSGGIYSYQGLKNGAPLADCLWTDTGGIFGTPGYIWGCGGYSVYSGGQFWSLGAYGMSCLDL